MIVTPGDCAHGNGGSRIQSEEVVHLIQKPDALCYASMEAKFNEAIREITLALSSGECAPHKESH